MKTHGPNSPQSIRGLRERRKLRGLLDTRRMAEADLRVAEYVAAFGKGFHKVKNPGGGEDYIVADQTGGRTFAPGTSILLGSQTGMPGEAVLGGAPAGKKGGIARTRATRRRGSTAPAASNQYAFGNDGVDLYAMLYSEGTYVSTRSTLTLPAETVCGVILTDSGLLVGDGSALLSTGATGTSIKVWDVEGATTYSYSVAAGWMLAAWPVYSDGAIYWLEVEDGTAISGHLDTTMQIRLCTALTDLTSDSVIRTETLNAGDFGGTLHWHADSFTQGTFMADSDGAVAYVTAVPHEAGHGTPYVSNYQWRWALSGGAGTYRDASADTYLPGVTSSLFCAALSAGGFRIAAGEVWGKTDDATNQATLIAAGISGLPRCINVGLDGTTYQTYSTTAGIPDGIYRNGATITTTVDAFDAVNYPDQMFYFGAD